MPIQVCVFDLDESRQELKTHGTPIFPCGGYFSDIARNVTGDIPWHWHEEIETMIVCQGAVQVSCGGDSFVLTKGEGIFINANVLHCMEIYGDEGCMINTLVFHASLIAGQTASIFEEKYVKPLLHCTELSYIPLKSEVPWQKEAAQYIQKGYDVYCGEEFGYELVVRENLSSIWNLVVRNNEGLLLQENKKESIDAVRVKTMLNFIHQNYSESLDVEKIAAQVNISEREALRCFQKTIGTSPIKYLMKFRVTRAIAFLSDTDMPITEIAAKCGFDSPSYFTLIFKRYTEKTPREYRLSTA